MRELTCDDPHDLETLYRGSLKVLPDGSVAQQVVVVGGAVSICDTDPGSANAEVTALGDAAGIGVYTRDADIDGRPSYVMGDWLLYWNAGTVSWSLQNGDASALYYSSTDTDYPWQATWPNDFAFGPLPPPTISCSEP